MNRKEHLEWCKKRAHGYVNSGNLSEAVASMLSDLTKHPETDGEMIPVLGMAGMISASQGDRDGVKRFIDGFN